MNPSQLQAFRLFVYADHAMLLVGLAAIITSIVWSIYAILPSSKGRRKRSLIRALIGVLVFAMFYGTQGSVLIAFLNPQWSPLQIILFTLPIVVMLVGLIASITCGVRAVLLRTAKQRRQMVLRSLLAVVVFGVGIAPHTAAILIPIISSDDDHANRPGTLTHVGDQVPDFELTNTDGTPFNTADLRGKVIVLNFFATWCGPCKMELTHLQDVWDEFRNNRDFRMLVVGREESDDGLRAFQQEQGFNFPMASDPDRSIFDKFASQSIPRTYLISRQGTIVYQCTGFYEDEIFRLKKLIRKELKKEK